MKITLTRGNETVEIEGDDTLIHESLCYQGSFERQVTKVTQGFYKTATVTDHLVDANNKVTP